MKRDDYGVAGFFEDLPVLMMVLGGTMCLVATGAWASKEMAERDLESGLEEVSEGLLGRFVAEAKRSAGPEGYLLVSSLEGVNSSVLAEHVPGGFGYSVSAVMLYPDTRWVFMASSEAGAEPASTGVSRVLLSALADDGRVAVVEVRAVAWPGGG